VPPNGGHSAFTRGGGGGPPVPPPGSAPADWGKKMYKLSRLTDSHISDLMRISIGGPEIPSLRFPDSDNSQSHSEFSQFIDADYSHSTLIPRRALE
jgi:hypothetical protein